MASGAESQSRIIDRTLVCRMPAFGYPDTVRYIGVSARPYDPGHDASPSIGAGSGRPGVPGAGVFVRTGPGAPGSQDPTGELSMTRTVTGRCANTRLRIPLSSQRLKAGPSDPFGVSYQCDVPAKVVIRIRAVFRQPAVFTVNRRFPDTEQAKGSIAAGYIAVRTLRGRTPIAFASVHDAGGKPRLFIAPSRCTRTN